MFTAGFFVYWLINMILVFLAVWLIYRGWKTGAVTVLTDLLLSFLTGAAAWFLSGLLVRIYPVWQDAWSDAVGRFIYERSAGRNTPWPGLNAFALDFYRQLMSFLIGFILFLVLFHVLAALIRRKIRNKRHSTGAVQTADRIAGALCGAVSFTLHACLAALILVSCQSSGILDGGRDIVSHTFLILPVRCAAQPVTGLILQDQKKAEEFWQKGIRICSEDMEELTAWCIENTIYEPDEKAE